MEEENQKERDDCKKMLPNLQKIKKTPKRGRWDGGISQWAGEGYQSCRIHKSTAEIPAHSGNSKMKKRQKKTKGKHLCLRKLSLLLYHDLWQQKQRSAAAACVLLVLPLLLVISEAKPGSAWASVCVSNKGLCFCLNLSTSFPLVTLLSEGQSSADALSRPPRSIPPLNLERNTSSEQNIKCVSPPNKLNWFMMFQMCFTLSKDTNCF